MKLISSLSIVLLLACGGNGSNFGPSSGVPPSATIGSLSGSEAGILCDWTNGKEGGYGRVLNCPDGSQTGTDPDKPSCLDVMAYIGVGCPSLVVSDVEDCANATGPNLCQIPTAAACANVNACFASLGI